MTEPFPDAVESEGKPQPCYQCEKKTLWVDPTLEAFICSEQCYDDAWHDYMATNRR